MEEVSVVPEPKQDSYMGKHQKDFDVLMLHLAQNLKHASGEELIKGLELWVTMFNIRRS